FAQPDALPWTSVRSLSPGTPITLVMTGQSVQENARYFLAGGDDDITFLEPERAALSKDARRFLLQTASTRPQFLLGTRGEYVEGDYRLTPSEFLLHGQAVASLGEIVRTITRCDITAVSAEPPASRSRWVAPTVI